MSGKSHSINIEIDNIEFAGITDDHIEECRKSLKDEILNALTTRLVKSVGDIKIVFNNRGFNRGGHNMGGFNIEIDNVDFVEIDDDKIENYRKSLKGHVKNALSGRRWISTSGDIKIVFNKK
jgi:hypothetical protein